MSFVVAKSTSAYLWLFVILGVRWDLARAASCYAPRQPVNGESRLLHSCEGTDCKIPEGTAVEPGNGLLYQCNSGYTLMGYGISVCIGTGNWTGNPRCDEIKCGRLHTESKIAYCRRLDDTVDCNLPVLPQTVAEVKCRPGYKNVNPLLQQSRKLTCRPDGKWEPEDSLICSPVCGRAPLKQRPLIHHGQRADIADFPWHSTLYQLKRSPTGNEKEFKCGATIIQPNLLLTAAHCVYDESTETAVDPRELFVLTGNIFLNYDFAGHNYAVVKNGVVKRVHVHCDYLGLKGSYLSDIALLELRDPFTLSDTLLPACLGDSALSEEILEPGEKGTVPGFGRTEKGKSSGILQAITVPYISYSQCRGSKNADRNRNFINGEKFCAGLDNGSAVCNGDSGGGLVFQRNNAWYLMGIVSVGLGFDSSSGDVSCDAFSYTLYTKVSHHIKWIWNIINELKRGQSPPPCITPLRSTLPTPTASTSQQAVPERTTTFLPISVQRKPEVSQFCVSPQQPKNGLWKLHRSLCNHLDGQNQHCEIPTGTELEVDSELIYTCAPEYKLSEDVTVFCESGGSWSSLPTCITK